VARASAVANAMLQYQWPLPRENPTFGHAAMMNNMMNGMSEMMWGMGVFGLLLIGILVLVIAALVKYVFFR
jgi:hypothetical protein